MNTRCLDNDSSKIQAAIYGVALSLDSFLLNGIPYGVLQRAIIPNFLEKTADNLLKDLAILEEFAPNGFAADHSKITAIMEALRAKCQRLIDAAMGLTSYTTMPFQQLRLALSQIPLLRKECVDLLQELEVRFRTPDPFYQSHPNHSAAAMDDFFANLVRLFEEERTTSTAGPG
jgi:hypothetical protein